MSMVRRIETTKRENLLLRTQRARQGLPPIAAIPKPTGSSLAKELDHLEREQTALRSGLTAKASTATQAAPTAAPVSRRGLTVAEKMARARQPAEPDGFERIGPYTVYDPERLKAAKSAAARRQLEQRVQEDRS